MRNTDMQAIDLFVTTLQMQRACTKLKFHSFSFVHYTLVAVCVTVHRQTKIVASLLRALF